MSEYRIGNGFDRHRLIEGRPLMLGGVDVPADFGPDGHSDGDVVLHSLVDAILGASGLGDIGDHFPPSDPQWKDANSAQFVEQALHEIRPRFRVVNIDVTVFLERPKLKDHKEAIRRSVAEICGLREGLVNVKAKTGEGVGVVGTGEVVEAHVAVLLQIV